MIILSRHALERMSRIRVPFGKRSTRRVTEEEVINDIKTYRKNYNYSHKYREYTIHGQLGRYCISFDGTLITIMKKSTDSCRLEYVRNKEKQRFIPANQEFPRVCERIRDIALSDSVNFGRRVPYKETVLSTT